MRMSKFLLSYLFKNKMTIALLEHTEIRDVYVRKRDLVFIKSVVAYILIK